MNARRKERMEKRKSGEEKERNIMREQVTHGKQ